MRTLFKKFAPIAIMAVMLVACGKNNKVGGVGGGPGNPGIFQGINGMYSPGAIGVQGIDQLIASIPCNSGGAQQYPNQYSQAGRQGQTFVCTGTGQNKMCNRSGVSVYNAGNIRVGRTYSGHIAIYKDINPSQGELTVLFCVDALYTPQAISSLTQVGINIKNQYVSMNGTFADLIADIYYSGSMYDAFYKAR